MRVYEIAKEVGIPNKDLLVKIRALGLEVNNHMSSLGEDDVARIKRSLEKEKHGGPVEAASPAKPAAATVVRRPSTKPKSETEVAATPVAEVRPVVPPPVIRRRVVDEPTGADDAPAHAAAVAPTSATSATSPGPAVTMRPRVESAPSQPTAQPPTAAHDIAPRRDSSPVIATAPVATPAPTATAAAVVAPVAAPAVPAPVVENRPAVTELANGSGPVAAAPVAAPVVVTPSAAAPMPARGLSSA